MSVRDTSREAFRSIQPDLNERQAAVLALLERSAPMTNKEIADALGWEINRVTPRVHELRSYGLVADFGKRKCRSTKRNAYAWGIAAKKPEPPPRMVPKVVEVDGMRMVRMVPAV